MLEVSGILRLLSTCACREQTLFLPAWSVWLSRACLRGTAVQGLTWEWLVSRREELLNLKAAFILISMKLGLLTVCQTSVLCLPSSSVTYHNLHVTEIILLTGQHSRVGGRKEKMFLACLLPISHAKFSYFSVMKTKPNPRPHHWKSHGCKFSDGSWAVQHYIKFDLRHPRVQDNSLKHTHSQEKWL